MNLQLGCNWQLQLPIDKCFVFTIANRSQNFTHRVCGINNHEFAHVNSIPDLRVTIDGHLKFDQHIDLIVGYIKLFQKHISFLKLSFTR